VVELDSQPGVDGQHIEGVTFSDVHIILDLLP
jgi:hypothetical protein